MLSHARPETTDIADLTTKGHLLRGDDVTILLVQKLIPVTSAPDGHYGRRSRPPFDDLLRIYVPFLTRPWIMHACHADASCHLGVTRTFTMLERFYWWVDMEVCSKWWVRRCRTPLDKQLAGLHSPPPCPTAREYPSVLTTLVPYRSQVEEILTSSSSRTSSADGRICSRTSPRTRVNVARRPLTLS